MPEQPVDDPILACLNATLNAACCGDRATAANLLASLDIEHSKIQREKRLLEVARGVRAASDGSVPKPRRRSIPFAQKHAVFSRDSYTCRVCGLKTVDLDVLRALSKVFPADLPYHRNWKFGVTSMIYWTHATSLEHIVPLARGGVDDPSNYATTCYGCNDARGDFLLEEVGWQLLAPTDEPWDGFRSWLPQLRQMADARQPKQG